MDVTVVGGGIVGCAAAALLAEAGARVTLCERDRIAAGASGRNQGVLQHPLDGVLTPLYLESMRLHAETAPALRLDRPPDGLLLVSATAGAPSELAAGIAATNPELEPVFVEDGRKLEPALAAGISACRLETGHQIPPAAATEAWAERAHHAGARIVLGGTQRRSADLTLIAAGPWSPVAVTPIWGVTASVRMADPPRHALEEAVIEEIATMAGEVAPAFAAVTADGVTTIGATFLAAEPDDARVAPGVLAHAVDFLPGIAAAPLIRSRACARPVSPDGRPLIGRLAGEDNVWVATGNGPWGMSCGPATARIAVDAMLGRGTIPPELHISRFG